jgi:hypothetical protein
MPFNSIGKERMRAKLDFRLPAEEKERIEQDARLAGISAGAMMRRRYFGRPIIAHADLATIKELRRLGGLLKKIHTESGGVYSNETYSVLMDIKAAITRLANQPTEPPGAS